MLDQLPKEGHLRSTAKMQTGPPHCDLSRNGRNICACARDCAGLHPRQAGVSVWTTLVVTPT